MNLRDDDDSTALAVAVAGGHRDVVRILCGAGASLARLSAEDLRVVVRMLMAC